MEVITSRNLLEITAVVPGQVVYPLLRYITSFLPARGNRTGFSVPPPSGRSANCDQNQLQFPW